MLLALSVNSRSRYALYSLYLVTGIGLSSWLSRTPAIKSVQSLTLDNVGMVLLSFSVGALLGILTAGKLVVSHKVGNVAFAGLVSLCLGLSLVSASGAFVNITLVISGLFLFGVGMGWADISINIEGAALEKLSRRQVLTALHGNFSLGAFIGALFGFFATRFEISYPAHLAFITLLIAIVIACVYSSAFQATTQKLNRDPTSTSPNWRHTLRDWQLLLICFIVLTMALIEGTANDWLPLLMIEGYDFNESEASMFYMIFSLCMATGRFIGGAIVERFGRTNVLILSSVMSAAGMILLVWFENRNVVIPATVIWAMGAALGFPVSLSAAGAAEKNGELRVKVATTAGYMAFLVGPPMLGFLGESFGLRMALLPVLVLNVLVLFLLLLGGGRRAIG